MSKKSKKSTKKVEKEDLVEIPLEETDESNDYLDNANWIKIRREFDVLNNIDEIFYFLSNLINETQICNSVNCAIFPELSQLDYLRLDFDYKTLKEAQTNIENKNMLKVFEENYIDYIKQSKSIFNKIFALKTTKETQYVNRRNRVMDMIEIISELNKNHFPVPLNVGKNLEIAVNDMSEDLLISSEDIDERKKKIDKINVNG